MQYQIIIRLKNKIEVLNLKLPEGAWIEVRKLNPMSEYIDDDEIVLEKLDLDIDKTIFEIPWKGSEWLG